MPCPPRISPPLHCARQAAPDDLLGQGMSPGHEHWKQKSSQICLHLCESANTKSCSTLIISKHSSAEEEISIDCIAVTTCWGFTTVGIEYWPSCWCCLWQSWECRLVGNCPAELLTVYIDKAFLQGIGEDLCDVGNLRTFVSTTLPQTHPVFLNFGIGLTFLKICRTSTCLNHTYKGTGNAFSGTYPERGQTSEKWIRDMVSMERVALNSEAYLFSSEVWRIRSSIVTRDVQGWRVR